MKIAFQIKVKNAAIMQAAEKMGGLRQLAEHLGVNYPALVAWGNLRVYPAYRNPRSKVDWKMIEKKLFDLTGLLLEEIFPPEIATAEFLAIPKKRVIVREVETLTLGAAAHLALPPTQEDQVYADELTKKLGDVLATLTPREEKVIKMRFGLAKDGEEHMLEEVAEHFGVTRERIRQIEATALRKLRHPGRTRPVQEWATGMTPKQAAMAAMHRPRRVRPIRGRGAAALQNMP